MDMSTSTNIFNSKMFSKMNSNGPVMSFAERLKERMDTQRIKAIDIATRLGVSRGTVSQWVNGIAEPRGGNASQVAAMLRCNMTWLMHGRGAPDKSVELEPGPELKREVPLISWIQAGNWLEMDIQQYDYSQSYTHTASVGPRAFALRVIGDSMTSATGKSIPEGAVVIVDPDIAADHGRVVVARLDESASATIKQLVIDGDQKYLKPLNPAYPMMAINGNCTIIGVVKQVIQDF